MAKLWHVDFEVPAWGEFETGPVADIGWASLMVDEWASLTVDQWDTMEV